MTPSPVDQDELDLPVGLQSVWAITFSVLYLVVITASILMYLAVVRTMAVLGARGENVTTFLVMFLGFSTLVECALVVEELILTTFGIFLFTTPNCRLFIYTLYGNRILQVCTVLTLLYFNLLSVHLKTTRYERNMKQMFPLVVVFLLAVELVTVIRPTLNLRANISDQQCEYEDVSTRQMDGWLYSVLLPYWVPLVLALPPCVILCLKMKEGEVLEPKKSQVRVSLTIGAGYFLFNLLYYILMAAKQVESSMLDQEEWHKLLGMTIWLITRPMFRLIGQGWHFMAPLACLTLDRDMRREWPGRLFVRMSREEAMLEEGSHSIVLETRVKEEEEQVTELSPQFSVLMLENREFHNPLPLH